MHRNATCAASPPLTSAQLHPLHAQSNAQVPKTPAPVPLQPSVRPQQYFGFAPFHQPQGQLQRESAPVPREPEPSSTLQPDSSIGIREQQRFEHPFPPPLPPSSVRAFDLEQSLDHAHQSEHSMLVLRSAGDDQIADASSMQQANEHPENQPSSTQNGVTSEQVDGSQLQLVPASEFSPHAQSDERLYPLPIATHDAVMQDRELFMATLDNFLAALGTRLTVPKFAGEDLDLHAIYREVTMRGGLAQVIRHALWNELVEALSILIPALNTSFVLRKHYTNLLYHYEQVHYFRAEGNFRSPPVPLLAPSPVLGVSGIGCPYEVPPDIGSALKKRKKKLDPIQIFGVDPAASVGTNVTGSINGKFEEGYIVTVVVGTEKVTGVLYHVPGNNDIQQFASVPSLVGSKWDAPGLEIQLQGKKKKDSLYKKDPNAPRRTRTGYNIFYKEQRARLRQLYPEKDKKISRMVIEMWSRLPGDEKSLYVERGHQDRERYKKECLEYKERMRLQAGSDDAGQPLTEHDHAAYDGSHDYHVSFDVEGDMMSYQGAQPQVSEMDELQPGQGYPVDEDGVGYNVNRPLNGDVGSEQPFRMQENEEEFPDEPMSEEEGDPDIDEAFAGDGDEVAYPVSGKGDNGQEDANGYHVSNEGHNVQDEGMLSSHLNKAPSHEMNVHGGYVVSEQPYYVQGHVYAYPSSLHRQVLGSGGLGSSGQVAYQFQDNGQVYHPHLQQSHPGASAGALSQQQYYAPDGYVFASVRNGQAFEAEALGVPVPSDQAGYHGQNEQLPYSSQLQHHQAVESNVQTRPVPSEQAYHPRYPYPMQLPYNQADRQPHAYPVHFSHTHGYSVHVPAETQTSQYEHAFSSHANQPQVMIPEVSGTAASSQQPYPVQDGEPTYHA